MRLHPTGYLVQEMLFDLTMPNCAETGSKWQLGGLLLRLRRDNTGQDGAYSLTVEVTDPSQVEDGDVHETFKEFLAKAGADPSEPVPLDTALWEASFLIPRDR